jgi:hypothetical protein
VGNLLEALRVKIFIVAHVGKLEAGIGVILGLFFCNGKVDNLKH